MKRRSFFITVLFVLIAAVLLTIHTGLAAQSETHDGRPDGYYLTFDGADDYVTLGDPGHLNLGGEITLEAWIKVDADGVTGIRNIIAHGHDVNPAREVFLRVNDGEYQVGSWDGSEHMAEATIPDEDLGEWVHLAGVYGSNVWRLYRNGVEVNADAEVVGAVGVDADWAIGARGNGGERFFKGAVDEVRIWSVARSAGEIAATIFDRQLPPQAGLAGAWSFEEGFGDVAYDSSDNRSTGRLGNGQAAHMPGRRLAYAGEPADTLSCELPPFGEQLALGDETELFLQTQHSDDTLRLHRLDQTAGDLVEEDVVIGPEGSLPAATTADLAANGHHAFIQASKAITNPRRLVIHRQGAEPVSWVDQTVFGSDVQELAVVGGRFVAGEREHIALAARPSDGGVIATLLETGPDGDILSGVDGQSVSWWGLSDGRSSATHLAAAKGDVDGNGIDEVILSFVDDFGELQIVVLAYDADRYAIGGPGGWGHEIRMRELTTLSVNVSESMAHEVRLGDVDGDFRDEIVLGWGQESVDVDGIYDRLRLHVFDVNGDGHFAETTWSSPQLSARELALAVGNTNLDSTADAPDFAAEIVVAHDTYSGDSGWTARTFTFDGSALAVHNQLSQNTATVHGFALAAADVDSDLAEEIVLAVQLDDAGVDDDKRIDVLHLRDQPEANRGLLSVGSWSLDTEATDETVLSLHAADWDDDALKAVYDAADLEFSCEEVTEREISAVVYRPPFWQNVQAGVNNYGSIGESQFVGYEEERSISNTESDSISWYTGAEVDTDFFEASVKYTSAYETSTSEVQGSGSISETETYQGHISYEDNFVLYTETALNCYTYGLRQGGAALDGTVRHCQIDRAETARTAVEQSSWHLRDNGRTIIDPNAESDASWAPAVRDWSSRSLFQETAHSAGCSDTWAENAVDSAILEDETSCDQQGAWWQVDLGSQQELSHVRVWSRSDSFHVFVSSVDPSQIDGHADPQAVQAFPGVTSFQRGETAGDVTTFLTLAPTGEPIKGRYIRVQSDGQPSLSLAEVQVFGPYHVDPDRYPSAVSDGDSDDGVFRARILIDGAPRWVETRGNLLWQGFADDSTRVQTGSPTRDWSLSRSTTEYDSNTTEYGWTTRHGVELDLAGGYYAKVVTGGAVEWASSVTKGTTRTTSWGSGFEIGGGVAGFPAEIGDNQVGWSDDCSYTFQPYYYEVEDESNFNFRQRYMVVDYLVTNTTFDEPGADTAYCRHGVYDTVGVDDPPTAGADDFSVMADSVGNLLDVLGNDRDPEEAALTITAVSSSLHGDVVIAGDELVYTPAAAYAGADSFTYTVSDGNQTAMATVTVSVVGIGPTSVFLPAVLR